MTADAERPTLKYLVEPGELLQGRGVKDCRSHRDRGHRKYTVHRIDSAGLSRDQGGQETIMEPAWDCAKSSAYMLCLCSLGVVVGQRE